MPTCDKSCPMLSVEIPWSDGQKREDIGALGWDTALEMYRPLMSYDELSGILEGSPSAFYDQLYKLLGLEQLSGHDAPRCRG
jgi:hypothetical protein